MRPLTGTACSLIGILAVAGACRGQTQPCGAAAGITGPDVIVGALGAGGENGTPNEIFNYAAQDIDGVLYDGVGAATYACNIGTAPLMWAAGTANRPVAAQGLYRYTRDTSTNVERFEMLGYAWLKYTFSALQHTLCCQTCETGGSGPTLGVGCADPYTSLRNANQNGLGPKWQINAALGTHPSSPSGPPFSGAAARRIQVAVTELPPSNGTTIRYFVEAQYISPDDAAAGNLHNNASHREVTCAGLGDVNKNFIWTQQLGHAATVRMRPAVEEWKLINPAVTQTTFIVPGDGKFFVMASVTDLGHGTWNYEYLVHNLNSDRSGGSFSVPMHDAVRESAIGFHDVTYHDGDGPGSVNFSGTDWPAVRSGGSLTWTTETFAHNQSANAIRWASAYNFRFVASAPPIDGLVTIGLWKPGTPESFQVAVPVPGQPLACPCDHDGNREIDSRDFFAFLEDFLAGDPRADFDGSTAVNSADFFGFLECFFDGCSAG